MGLQINPPPKIEAPGVPPGDDWGTRIAKLIPAEALGLYGSAVAIVPNNGTNAHDLAIWAIVIVCCVLLLIIRFRSARDPATGKPQYGAILISLLSFFIWLFAVGPPTAPFGPPLGYEFFGPLTALLWGTIAPYFYKG